MRVPVELPARFPDSVDAIGFGLNTVDYLAVVDQHPRLGSKTPISEFAVSPGGQAATAMVAVSRLGWTAKYIGRFGSDDNGLIGKKSLKDAGVDISDCQTISGAKTAVSLILVSEQSGERTVLWTMDEKVNMSSHDIQENMFSKGRLLLVDCHQTEASATAARFAKKNGLPTVVDVEKVRPGIEKLLENIDLLITAEEFPLEYTGKPGLGVALKYLQQEFGAKMVCSTLGAQGSLALVGNKEIRTLGFSVDVADTTGAGDVFRGGFISGWLLGENRSLLEDVLKYANAVAALKCKTLGGRDGIPSRRDVEEFLRS
tara:strand:+ start:1513 stop:2457 length:945 start_codon:yes stop_codon:yes gene_type:complete